jgi:hypothetical protein
MTAWNSSAAGSSHEISALTPSSPYELLDLCQRCTLAWGHDECQSMNDAFSHRIAWLLLLDRYATIS